MEREASYYITAALRVGTGVETVLRKNRQPLRTQESWQEKFPENNAQPQG